MKKMMGSRKPASAFFLCLWLSLGLDLGLGLEAMEVQNAEVLREHYGVSPWKHHLSSKIKVAVLDSGFGGYTPGHKDLPSGSVLVGQYSQEFLKRHQLSPETSGNPLLPLKHGLMMAQIVWTMTGGLEEGPQFYLLNANGLTQFQRAVQYALDEKVDVIVHSQNWEYGGNFDGGGVFNQAVSKATDSGILWINAAGNYGESVFNGKIRDGETTTLRFENLLDENPLSFFLSWNDYTDDENYQSQKDLDFFLYDSQGVLLEKGNRTQVKKGNGEERGAPSQLAREMMRKVLDRGTFTLKIQNQSENFDETRDFLRVILKSEKSSSSFRFEGATKGREIMIPADHPQVLAVGDKGPYSALGPTMDGRIKPEVMLDETKVVFSTGEETLGTSNAAALFAGMALLIKSKCPSLERRDYLALVKKVSCSDGPSPSRVEEELPPAVVRALKRVLGDDLRGFQGWRLETLENGRKVLWSPYEPVQLPVLYDNVAAEGLRLRLPPRAFSYFIAPTNNPQNRMGVDTYFYLKTRPLPLPMDYTDSPGLRWIEIRKDPSSSPARSGSGERESLPRCPFRLPSPGSLDC